MITLTPAELADIVTALAVAANTFDDLQDARSSARFAATLDKFADHILDAGPTTLMTRIRG